MPVTNRASVSAAELRTKTAAVHAARRKLMAKNRRRVQRAVAVRQFNDTVREIAEALVPIFVEQGRSIVDRIREVQVPVSASELVRLVFDPTEWRDKFVDRLLPILARRMAEAGAVHLLTYGIDVRKMPRGKRLGHNTNQPEIVAGRKATTASEWLASNADDWDSLEEVFRSSGTPMGILTEIPEWMKKSIVKRLDESFSQDYWTAISEATMGDAERVLRQGLTEGWSVAKMSQELRHYFEDDGFRYARFRAETIARTESGNALNSARKDSVARLQQELGDRVPMKQSWHSVLGNTTRATHAMLDGVPEDKDGMWELSGYRVPWPGHYSLPVEERANCQCSLTIEFGMREEEAQAEIEEYFARVAGSSEEQEDTGKDFAAVQLKYPGQPRDDLGRFSSGGGGGGGSGGGGSRSERAKRTHKPSTKEKQRRGRLEQDRLAKELGGQSTPDNDAFDVLLGRHAIEVKTIMDNKNNKVTVHPSSRRRKLAYEKKHGVKGHLVAIDVRGGKREYYYRDSVGSYKLSAMERVSLSELKRKLGA